MTDGHIEQTSPLITPAMIRFFWIVVVGLGLGALVPIVPLPYLAGVVVTLIAALLILHNPYWGLLAYLIVFLVRPQEIWTSFGGYLPIEKTLAIAILVATIVSPKIRGGNKIVFSKTSAAMLALTGLMFVTVPFAVWRGGALDYAVDFAKKAIVFFLITQLCDTPRRLRIFVWLYLLCHLWLAGSTLFNYYTEPAYIRMGIQRAKGYTYTMGNPNAVAASLAFAIPFALLWIKDYRKLLVRLLLVCSIVLSVYTVIFTGSRSGMVTLIVLAFILAFRMKHKIPALMVTVGILLSIWTMMPEMYQKRFMTMFEPEEEQWGAEESARARWQGFAMGITMFLDRPFLGVGVGNFAPAWYWKYTYKGTHAWSQSHNMPGQLIGELGGLGLIVFGLFFYLAVRQNRRISGFLHRLPRPPPELIGFKAINASIGVAFILLMISGLFGHNLYRYNWYYFAAIGVAMESILLRYQEKTLPAKPGDHRLLGGSHDNE